MTASQEITKFLAWAEENEIKWDKDAIEIREGKHGLGVYAKKNLEDGLEAIQIPKEIVLSIQTTGIANLLEDEDMESFVALTLAGMYELSRGEQSPWAPYLALIATRRPQMVFDLAEDSRELMKTSEIYNEIDEDIKETLNDYEEAVLPFLAKHAEIFTEEIKAKFFSFEDYKTMATLVTSRSMDVDDYHLSAMVPFADLINHAAEPNSDFLAHDEVCEICGAVSCEHMEEDDDEEDDEEAPELPAGEEKKAKRAAKKAEAGDEEEDDEDDEDDEDWEEDIEDTCDIVLEADVKKGEEITRHYGPLPNKIYLGNYGFAEIDNPNDAITVQLDMVRKAAEAILGDAALVEERVDWFLATEDVFITRTEFDDDEEHDHEHGEGCNHGDDHEHKKVSASEEAAEAADAADEEDDEEEEEDEEEFPRDIFHVLQDGTVDDRLLLLLNVLFMGKDKFDKVQGSMEVATQHFDDMFLRRHLEDIEDESDSESEDEDEPKLEAKPLDDEGRQVHRSVLEATLALIRIRADAYGVTNKTSAEDDLAALKKSGLTGVLFYAGVCVQGEKQIIERALAHYGKLLAAL